MPYVGFTFEYTTTAMLDRWHKSSPRTNMKTRLSILAALMVVGLIVVDSEFLTPRIPEGGDLERLEMAEKYVANNERLFGTLIAGYMGKQLDGSSRDGVGRPVLAKVAAGERDWKFELDSEQENSVIATSRTALEGSGIEIVAAFKLTLAERVQVSIDLGRSVVSYEPSLAER